MAKSKTYYTKADLMSFAEHLLGDERRAKFQKQTRQAGENGTLDPIPWAVRVRIVTEDDFKEWKQKREEELNTN